MSRGTGSIRSRFSAYASTLRTIWSVVWSMSCMRQSLRPAPRNDEHGDGGVPQDLGRTGTEEDLGDGPELARPDHEHVALVPGDVVERLGPARAPADHRLDRWRGIEVLDLRRRPRARCLLASSAVHSLSTSSSESVPSRVVYAGRAHTANEAIRSDAPVRAATVAAAMTRSSAPADPPYAAVARVTSRPGRAPEPARGEAEGHRRAVHQPVGDAAQGDVAVGAVRGRPEHDHVGAVLLGELEQADRGRPGAVRDERRRHVVGQVLPGAVERLARPSGRGTRGTPRRPWPCRGSTAPGPPRRPPGPRRRTGPARAPRCRAAFPRSSGA